MAMLLQLVPKGNERLDVASTSHDLYDDIQLEYPLPTLLHTWRRRLETGRRWSKGEF